MAEPRGELALSESLRLREAARECRHSPPPLAALPALAALPPLAALPALASPNVRGRRQQGRGGSYSIEFERFQFAIQRIFDGALTLVALARRCVLLSDFAAAALVDVSY